MEVLQALIGTLPDSTLGLLAALTVSTAAQALTVNFAMKSNASVLSQQILYIDYFSWNILKLG